MNIALFDFDGTITEKDSMFQFIRFAKGKVNYFFGLLFLSPVFMAFKFGFIPNWRGKEILLSYFFKGTKEADLIKLGAEFAEKVIPLIVKPEAIDEIDKHKKSGSKIVVVTASFPIWVQPWCDSSQIELIATNYEVVDGKFTGIIKGLNCHGPEKGRRIRELYDLKSFDKIFAYGNSPADHEMLNLADEKFMKWEKVN